MQPAEPFDGHAQKKKPKFPKQQTWLGFSEQKSWSFAITVPSYPDDSIISSSCHAPSTQMGKSMLLSLANLIYDRNTKAPKLQTTIFLPEEVNSCFFTFWWPRRGQHQIK
jgi:hypothetical protein